MNNFKIYLIVYIFGIMVGVIGGIILYQQIGGWGLVGVILLFYANNLTGPYKEDDK